MIDDDFDKLVRNMLERLFGNSFGMVPGENGIQMRVGSEDSLTSEMNRGQNLIVDKIDLGDEFLVIIDVPVSVESPLAIIKDRRLEIRVSELVRRGVVIEIPFEVDIEKSSISNQNGVIEARLVRTSDKITSRNEGTLRVI
ncbi:MAG: hypothetical protein KAQ65_09965 [Candidatus Thorarchaeota archaeon]|nr:hypothetical protein [Candidatus Thorarchaeota archaeon]